MTDEKLQSIQEKIHAERLKIQEKFNKNQGISQKIEEIPQKTEKFKPKKVEETKKNIKSEIDREFDKIAFNRKRYDRDSPSHSGATIIGAIMLMIVGFSMLTLGSFIMNSILESAVFSESSNIAPELISYVNTIFPLLGLAVMVAGFAGILNSLRCSL
jgi:hypothetical protein